MGIKLTIPFEIDGEEEQIEMEIFPDKSIDFINYDIDTDIMAVELGDEPSEIYSFYKGFDGFEGRGLTVFARSPEWAESLFYAIDKQGLEGFSETSYLRFLQHCLEDEWKYGFEPLDAIKETFSKEKYINILKELVADSHFSYKSFDPVDTLLEEISKEDFVDWLIEYIKSDIEASTGGHYYHSKASHLASILNQYIESSDVELTESYLDMYNVENEYTSAIGKDYCLSVMGQELGYWKIVVECRILDPIGFHSDCEEWQPETYGHEYGVPDVLSQVMSELEIEEPELDDPDPPDFPKFDLGGDFATVYFMKKPSHYGIHSPEWMLAPYDSEYSASEAAELSSSIMDRDGMRDDFDIFIAKKKEDPDKKAEKKILKEFNKGRIWGEHADEVKDRWADIEWTKVYDVVEEIND